MLRGGGGKATKHFILVDLLNCQVLARLIIACWNPIEQVQQTVFFCASTNGPVEHVDPAQSMRRQKDCPPPSQTKTATVRTTTVERQHLRGVVPVILYCYIRSLGQVQPPLKVIVLGKPLYLLSAS